MQPHGQMTHDNNDTRISKEESCNEEVVRRETADSEETEDQPKVSMFCPLTLVLCVTTC